MSRLVFDYKNKTMQYQKNGINKDKKVSLLIKNFVVGKKTHKKLLISCFLGFLKKITLNTEINNNLYRVTKLSANGKHISLTH